MNSATKILDIAERRMRQTGYNAVSYRNIAEEMGIKSASLHYHFPKKEQLGEALVERYSENFAAALSHINAQGKPAQQNIQAFVDIYRHELTQNRLVCLCAVLGAEAAGLPARVNAKVNQFFSGNTAWLEQQYDTLGAADPANDAKITIALLSGAMMMSAVQNDNSIFEAAAQSIREKSA